MKWWSREKKPDPILEEFRRTYLEFGIGHGESYLVMPTLIMQRIMELEKELERLKDATV